MTERQRILDDLSDEELEAQTAEQLPDRKAISTVNADPAEIGFVAIEELPQPPEDAEQ